MNRRIDIKILYDNPTDFVPDEPAREGEDKSSEPENSTGDQKEPAKP
jgi:hypothetical protein